MIKHSCCSIGSETRLLLREVDHRVRNEIASAINLVAVAAVRAESCDVKSALSQVVELLHDHADVHSALRIPEHDQLVDAAENLRKLVVAISRSRLERMKINLVFAANTLPMEADRCWRLRLAVNELITNAARHAPFRRPAGRDKNRSRAGGKLCRMQGVRQWNERCADKAGARLEDCGRACP